MGEPETWHHGLVATWWAEFNDDFRPHEIAYYLDAMAEGGGPVLDAGCGAGRLLVPALEAGLDVDGCDVSPDMLSACRDRAVAAGHEPSLSQQALHELDLPRRYATIVVVGTFGLGSDRARDLEALRRLRRHLLPGGRLLVDQEVPYADPGLWWRWPRGRRRDLPEAMPEGGEPREARDGAAYTLRSRLLSLDPLLQRVTLEMLAQRFRDGRLDAEERHRLDITYYFPYELQLLLHRAGFADVELHGEHERRPPTADDEFVVAVAR